MPVKIVSTICLLVLMWIVSGKAYALCLPIQPMREATLDMDIGRITVPPEAPPGTVLTSRTWTLNEPNTSYYCRGEAHFEAEVDNSLVKPMGNNVYATNIEGIGLRFSIRLKTGSEVNYPQMFQEHYPDKDIKWELSGSVFKVEVIKTAVNTGSGAVTAGRYTMLRQKHGVYTALTTRFNGQSLVIVSASCRMEGGNQQHVNLRHINMSALRGIGSTAGQQPFTLQLKCQGGGGTETAAKVNMAWEGESPAGIQVDGLLKNLDNRSIAAQGIGFQVLDKDKQPLVFRKKYEVGNLNNQPNQLVTLLFFVHYYQYAEKIQSGPVEALMTFKIDYQ